jgi:hypothetical protein
MRDTAPHGQPKDQRKVGQRVWGRGVDDARQACQLGPSFCSGSAVQQLGRTRETDGKMEARASERALRQVAFEQHAFEHRQPFLGSRPYRRAVPPELGEHTRGSLDWLHSRPLPARPQTFQRLIGPNQTVRHSQVFLEQRVTLLCKAGGDPVSDTILLRASVRQRKRAGQNWKAFQNWMTAENYVFSLSPKRKLSADGAGRGEVRWDRDHGRYV